MAARTAVAARVTAIGAALVAVWLLGHGTYIYAKAQLAQVLLHNAWQRTLDGGKQEKPWPWADTWPVARLRSIEHAIDTIVLAGDSGRVLAFGPGANFGYALPGANGTRVISAHRDTHFAFLRDVRTGQRIELQNSTGRWETYTVTATQVVDARDPLGITDEQLVLVTCYPFDALIPGGSQRYVVRANAM